MASAQGFDQNKLASFTTAEFFDANAMEQHTVRPRFNCTFIFKERRILLTNLLRFKWNFVEFMTETITVGHGARRPHGTSQVQ